MCFDNYYLLDDMEKYNPSFDRSMHENIPKEILIPLFRTYYSEHLPVDVTTWCRVNAPADNLIYKDGLGDQIRFIRDTVVGIFITEYEEYKHHQPMVISTHMSKSVTLPVLKLDIPKYNLSMVFRYNFYDWKISIVSEYPLDIDFGNLFTENKDPIHRIYCEGFPQDCIYGRFADNKCKFTIEVYNDHRVYTIIWFINNYLQNFEKLS